MGETPTPPSLCTVDCPGRIERQTIAHFRILVDDNRYGGEDMGISFTTRDALLVQALPGVAPGQRGDGFTASWLRLAAQRPDDHRLKADHSTTAQTSRNSDQTTIKPIRFRLLACGLQEAMTFFQGGEYGLYGLGFMASASDRPARPQGAGPLDHPALLQGLHGVDLGGPDRVPDPGVPPPSSGPCVSDLRPALAGL